MMHISASSIAMLKQCPYSHYLKYTLGVLPIEDTDAQRMGTNWHKVLEIGDTDKVIAHLNEAYKTVPLSKTAEEWQTEQVILLNTFLAYDRIYSHDVFDVVANEIPFKLQLADDAIVLGKIDKIARNVISGHHFIVEHKSTSSSLDSDSSYWSHLTLDTQTTLYPFSTQILQLNNDLVKFGIKPDDPLISEVLYDVWRKPTIRPKKLTQADSKKFVDINSETHGQYCGRQFKIKTELKDNPHCGYLLVNGIPPEMEPGKKEGTFTIRETPDMFGARLYQDMMERPDHYFARRLIGRTTQQLDGFNTELYGIYEAIKYLSEHDYRCWKNERHCEATYKCPFIPICYNHAEIDINNPPEGFELRKDKKNAMSKA